MGIPNVTIQFLPVFLTSILSIIFSALWYSPLLFGNIWAKLAGVHKPSNKVQMQRAMRRAYALTFVTTLIATYVLAQFVAYLTVSSFGDGLRLAFLAWLAFELPLVLNDVLWGGKSWKLFLLNAAHHYLALALAVCLLIAFQ